MNDEDIENNIDDIENNVIEIDGDMEDSDIGIEAPEVKIDYEDLKMQGMEFIQQVIEWAQSPKFYAQLGIIVAAIVIALFASKLIGKYLKAPSVPPQAGSMSKWRDLFFRLKGVLFPLFLLLFLGIGVEIVAASVQQSWLVRIAQSLAVVGFIYAVITQFIHSDTVKKFVKWIAIPLALLHVFGWLDDVTAYLDSIKLQIGNISISLNAVARVIIFGSVLFWLGRISNDTGKQFIRKQENIEIGTREVFAKLFEIALYVLIFILLLQVMGINLTALAVFGGAVGVGLGFGLQAIASNFISGLIILLDRSLTVGDYIELEDGRSGTIRALNMRSTILKTFDGKDIMVPNESFITTSFINWTHENKKQRYGIEFQVAYDTDVEKLVKVLKDTVAQHPQVISGSEYTEEEQPDAEICGFGESGIDILVEYWMVGIDDGLNRVDADLNMMIWKALRANNMQMPFPQREVRIINPS
ncbi:MAG: mechanosensitive ion channel [Gammaproteobacteria bacterium]|nr:mechanosensitive ion channel [Gammaproteobacteria bacterium]